MTSTSDNLDPYIRYMKSGGKSPFTPKQQQRWDRMQQANDLLREYKLEPVVLDMMVAMYRKKLKRYSITTARRDVTNARIVFGYKPQQEKAYLRGFFTDWAIERMKKADAADDNKGFAAILDKVVRMNRLDHQEADLPDPDDLRNPIPTLMVVDPGVLNLPKLPEAERAMRIQAILAGKKAEGFNIQDLTEGEDFTLIPDGDPGG